MFQHILAACVILAAFTSAMSQTAQPADAEQDADILKANSYDDAWKTGPDGWATTLRRLCARAPDKTDGFVVLCGDSITYAQAFGQWPRSGAGKTAADRAICDWMHADHWGDGSNTSDNGWYLASHRVRAGGSFTAQGGIIPSQYLTGSSSLPSVDQMFTAGFTNPDGRQYRDAVMAVILLGTNDLFDGSAAQLHTNLDTIVDRFLAARIIPILTTLPPCLGLSAQVADYNLAVRNAAQTRKVPLIDLYAEILRRRPGSTWQFTLICSDGVHPSNVSDPYDCASDPYANNGEPLSDVGYLLRSWLTVQKIAEVKAKALTIIPGDIDLDGHVDIADQQIMETTWTLSRGENAFDERCDLNANGVVDLVDLLTLLQNLGK